MGAYAELKVKNLTLLSWKNYFDKEALGLFFTDDDLIITKNVKYDELDEDETPHTEYKYSTTVKRAVQRLNSIGYTLKRIESDFECNKNNCLDYFHLLYKLEIDDRYDEVKEQRINKFVTFKKWQNSIKKYAKYESENGSLMFQSYEKKVPDYINPKTECDKLVYHSLTDYNSESFYGCLYSEFNSINTIRLILEIFDENEELYVEVSELLDWSYESIEDMRIGEPTEKTIVLVEGTSDKGILEFSLKHIYPHLYNLYYFMDFEYAKNKKRQGGVDAISNNLKTFITSKLKAKFIAIFDNDTIGNHAKKRLDFEIGSIPNNCKILTYPNIKLAKRYPTIAINGKIVLDNINEKACSIELYLPNFLLKTKDNIYSPIEWESRVQCTVGEDKLIGYQGTIFDKDLIKKAFHKYENDVENGRKSFDLNDWSNMNQLIDHIVTAFN